MPFEVFSCSCIDEQYFDGYKNIYVFYYPKTTEKACDISAENDRALFNHGLKS